MTDKNCENCNYYDEDIDTQPCCSCNNKENFEADTNVGSKMESKDIIKALEYCAEHGMCDDCPYQHKQYDCSDYLKTDALNLIKQQQAEIERLTANDKRLKKVQMQLDDMCIMHNIIKTEAYKEFWEVLKVRAKERVDYYTPQGCDHYFSNGTLCGYTAMLEAGEKLLTELKTGTIVIVKQGGVQE